MLEKSNVFYISRLATDLLHGPKRDVSRSLRRVLQQVVGTPINGRSFIIQSFAFDEGHNATQLRGIELYAIDLAKQLAGLEALGVSRQLPTIRDDMFSSVHNTYELTINVETASLKELQDAVTLVMELAYSLHRYAGNPSVTAELEDYQYRGLGCNIAPDSELWFVAGVDKRGGSGVLEWCFDEADAKDVLEQMQRYPERFSQLKAESWVQSQGQSLPMAA